VVSTVFFILHHMWQWYQRTVKARPLVTNIATAAIVMFTADATAQIIEHQRRPRPTPISGGAALPNINAEEDLGRSRSVDHTASMVAPRPIVGGAADNDDSSLEWQERDDDFRLRDFDVCRSVTMTSWNSLVFAPFFLVWFRFLDRSFGSSVRGCITKVLVNQMVRRWRRRAWSAGRRRPWGLRWGVRIHVDVLIDLFLSLTRSLAPSCPQIVTIPLNVGAVTYSVSMEVRVAGGRRVSLFDLVPYRGWNCMSVQWSRTAALAPALSVFDLCGAIMTPQQAALRAALPLTPSSSPKAAAAATPVEEHDKERKTPRAASSSSTTATSSSSTSSSSLSSPLVRVPLSLPAVQSELEQRLSLDVYALFRGSVLFWVPVNLLNFLLVPPHLRVLPTIVASTAWNTYLSLTTHKKH
jgi:hypothetical protein